MKSKECRECGRVFMPRCGTQRYCDGPHQTECKYCGRIFSYTCSPNEKPKYCSQQCINEGKKQTVRAKYGVDNVSELAEVREKISKANSSEEVVAKRRSTSLKNWGVDNPAKSPEVKAKQKATFLEKYGVDNPMKNDTIAKLLSDIMSSPEHVEAHRQHLLEKYGVTCTNDIPGVREKMIETTMKNHGVPYYVMSPEYLNPEKSNVISQVNKSIAKRLNSRNIETEFEYRIDRKCYDIHILNTNILLEIDPTYTHNGVGNHWDKNGLPAKYHLEKTMLAIENGYRCIHVFDWDNLDKVIKLVTPKTSIHARNCTLAEIDYNTASRFELKHHLQGDCRGQEICLGLYHNGELMEVMTFGKPRYNKKYQWELLRLCTHSDYGVAGGAQKLFSYFLRVHNPESIISYCDLAKFTGQVYEKLGFTLHHTTEPTKVWSKGNERVTNNLLLLRGYDQLFNANYGKGTSNEELMLKDGWLPVYNCGQNVYEWRCNVEASNVL